MIHFAAHSCQETRKPWWREYSGQFHANTLTRSAIATAPCMTVLCARHLPSDAYGQGMYRENTYVCTQDEALMDRTYLE